MDLLVVRHARAEDRDKFAATGKPDSERPLTPKGIRRMTKAARGLRALVPTIDLLLSSPFRRAVETAQIISEAYGGMEYILRDELSSDPMPERLIAWLAGEKQSGVLCIVGHEPDLSALIESLLTDPSLAPAKVKKGSATLIRFNGPVAASSGRLQWHQSARELAPGCE
jgi:phosphohistidine phosphatase